MKKNSIIRISIVILVSIIIAIALFNSGMKEIKSLKIKNVALSELKDGDYSGNYKKGRWTYSVSVSIKNHSIIQIKVLDKKMNEMFNEINIKIADKVIKEQSLLIDTVSGASVTTKAMLKAIENALSN